MTARTTLIHAAGSLADRLRSLLLRPSRRADVHPFDREHGVETGGLMYADKLATGHAHDRYSEGYYATAPSLFRELMRAWQDTLARAGPAIEDYSFIDLGCGKGRVLLLASEVPFRSIAGVELNAKLARMARRNVRKWMRAAVRDGNWMGRAGRNVTVEHADVLDLRLPPGPVVLFLYNSFGAEVVGALMAKLAAVAPTRSGPIDLLYVHPDHDALVARTPGIELLRSAEIRFSEEDAAADVFGVASDFCTVYRLRGTTSAKG
ncbi:MAG TPA: class I SAM-dependent methyltransferase [Terracidiphilus sp.]|jgi:SAM-dependent methyltransferase|nr:class I SAM-dependent methyltransferase [Terracidiphilus sp.]